MSRQSRDELAPDGTILNGFDYSLQVWVAEGIIQCCAHPERMRLNGPCCNQARYAGARLNLITGHEQRA